jgi:hypothetical protein
MSAPTQPPDGARRGRFQFTFWTLAEIVVGASIACWLWVEFDYLGLLIGALGILVVAAGCYAVRAETRSSRLKRVPLVLLAGSPFVLCSGVSPLIGSAQQEARRSTCSSNLKGLGLAMHNYFDRYRSFPPAYLLGPDGRPWHSWRVLILPFLGEQALYDRYDFSQP